MDGRLADRVVLIVGAGTVAGAAVTRVLADQGARLALVGGHDLRPLATDVAAAVVPADLTSPASVRRMVEQTLGAFGRLDAAVNLPAAEPFPDGWRVEEFDNAVALGLRATFLSMKYQIPGMLAHGGGSIVNVDAGLGIADLTRAAAAAHSHAALSIHLAAADCRPEEILDLCDGTRGKTGDFADSPRLRSSLTSRT